jgi:ABC-type transport system involved in multi-copper enzyme maturation permease subunit
LSSLLLVEFRRFAARRLVRVTTLLALGGIAFGTFLAFTNHYTLVSTPDIALGTAFPFVVIGWLVGASFIGAEWHAGTVTTLLTWEPRRVRVVLTKAIAAVVSVFALTLALQAVLAGSLALAASINGSTAGAEGWLTETGAVAIRVSVLAALAGAIGFAFAAVGRNTAAALGAGFAYVVVVENLVRGLKPEWIRWLFGENAGLFLLGPSNDFPYMQRSQLGAGIYLALLSATLVGVATLVFRTRDVN